MMNEKEIRKFLWTEGAGRMVVEEVIRRRRDSHLQDQIRAMAQVDGSGEAREKNHEADRYGAMANSLTWALNVVRSKDMILEFIVDNEIKGVK